MKLLLVTSLFIVYSHHLYASNSSIGSPQVMMCEKLFTVGNKTFERAEFIFNKLVHGESKLNWAQQPIQVPDLIRMTIEKVELIAGEKLDQPYEDYRQISGYDQAKKKPDAIKIQLLRKIAKNIALAEARVAEEFKLDLRQIQEDLDNIYTPQANLAFWIVTDHLSKEVDPNPTSLDRKIHKAFYRELRIFHPKLADYLEMQEDYYVNRDNDGVLHHRYSAGAPLDTYTRLTGRRIILNFPETHQFIDNKNTRWLRNKKEIAPIDSISYLKQFLVALAKSRDLDENELVIDLLNQVSVVHPEIAKKLPFQASPKTATEIDRDLQALQIALLESDSN